ncbi:MAG TPA: hypothetical protein VLC50_00040 [Actinomycetes bacterium]|nr:hypothetical protein [Actinomycetes bacterium]
MTEQLLTRLPASRWMWVIGAALVPWLNLALVWAWDTDEWRTDGVPIGEVLNRAAVSLAVLLSIAHGGRRRCAARRRDRSR